MPHQRDENLFHESTMTFGEHLDELRVCLFRALIGLIIGFVIGLLPGVGPRVVEFIQSPLQEALGEYYADRSLEKIKELEDSGEVDSDLAKNWTELVEAGWILDIRYVPREVLGEQGVGVQLNPAEHAWNPFGPNHVLASDVRDAATICQKITSAENSGGTSADRRIWDLLSEDQRAELAEVAAAGAWDQDQREKLAALLDAVIERADLHEEAAFADVDLTSEAERFLARDNDLSVAERRRLNRLLLEAAFPDAIVRTFSALIVWPTMTPVEDDPRTRTSSLSVHEPFMVYIKAALLTGAILSSPWVFFQLWLFVAAGLYPHERSYVYIFLPFSLGLFLAGAALAFFFVFEPVLQFLLTFNAWMGIDSEPRISEWLSFVVLLPLGFGVAFQLPLVMLFLERIGVFDVTAYRQRWRIAILVIAVLSMFLTPADPTSMLLMWIPLVMLYGLGILLCIYMPKRKSPFDES